MKDRGRNHVRAILRELGLSLHQINQAGPEDQPGLPAIGQAHPPGSAVCRREPVNIAGCQELGRGLVGNEAVRDELAKRIGWVRVGHGSGGADKEAGREVVGDAVGGEAAVGGGEGFLLRGIEVAAVVAVVLRRRELVEEPAAEGGTTVGQG